MLRREFMSRLVGWGCVGGTACCAAGCGTLMHSERRGQPRSNDIDWNIAALDGLGLVLFFVPGVVAFAVDFYTGAIYLPAGPEQSFPEYVPGSQQAPSAISHQSPAVLPATPNANYSVSPPPAEQQGPARQDLGSVDLERLTVPRDELRLQRIEQVVTNHLGRLVSLSDSHARVSRLSRLDRFAGQCHRHRTDRTFGHRMQTFFGRFQRA